MVIRNQSVVLLIFLSALSACNPSTLVVPEPSASPSPTPRPTVTPRPRSSSTASASPSSGSSGSPSPGASASGSASAAAGASASPSATATPDPAAFRAHQLSIQLGSETEVRYKYTLSASISQSSQNSNQTILESSETYKIRFKPAKEDKMEIDSTIEESTTVYYDLIDGQRKNERPYYSAPSLDGFVIAQATAMPTAMATASAQATASASASASAAPTPTPTPSPPSKHYQALIRTNGEIIEVLNLKELYTQAFGSYGTYIYNLPDTHISRISFDTRYKPYIDTLVSNHFRPFFSIYPLVTVRVGESWVTKVPVIPDSVFKQSGTDLKTKVAFNWRLSEVGEANKLNYYGEQELFQQTQRLILKHKGEARVDSKTGLLQELRVSTDQVNSKGTATKAISFEVKRM